ncbi:DEAD/DEAH box helicase [Duncaniella muris]|jgi:superfamily II DNA/RNA helicase|uniref:DEAD/DEAH box helicase n=1 Tax=Duncaniella muris TaxID=2094150 RepID=UPI000F4AE9EB|nr:DEAD/DEAH box helicase [Duncaniella muris]ROS95782.1 DEAD/DEAH box helicase [Muribaculaceae bacterium Isolate-077 (Janvier)]ROS97927.1 DEAD/DEAH box helicase [Muribaculaceae bacterium Isolate-083 (Janvier)]ROS99074.1 DEAD/DEAH box helicase [Muribaculaceae bacterium Isolate-084 (Janvier)]
MKFDELDLSYDILDALDAMRFDECTPIQEQAIPVILEGRDLIAVAQTGTGKTAAYLLPVIDRLADMPEAKDYVNCIVMSPTRELAQQIDRQMEGFAYYVPVNSVAIYGGTDGAGFAQQQRGLKMGADVVIATPGRLLAHLQMGYVDLSRVSYFILDEADRMLDMGFYDDIMQIVKHLPKDRQTLMFSATMPPKIQQLAKAILNDPAEVKIAVSRPTEKIDQSAFVCHEGQKTGILKHLFRTAHSQRVIIFSSSKIKVKELARELRRCKVKTGEMHSDLDQNVREEVLLDFRAGKIDVLVATDIVARGIDIDDIAMVVNYDVPREAEDYVHRIGRTARANADGKAVTLVSAKEQSKFGQIENFLGYEVRKETVPAELGEAPEYNPSRRQSSRGDRRNRKPSRSGGKGRKGNSSNNDKSNNNSISNSNKRNSRKNHQNHSRKKTSEGANGSNSSKNSSTPAQS